MAEQIWPGQVVKLASGGPAMTVVSVQEGPEGVQVATCIWYFETTGGYQSGVFAVHTLSLQ